MKRFVGFLAAIVFVFCFSALTSQGFANAEGNFSLDDIDVDQVRVIYGATILPMDGTGPQPNKFVIVYEGRILAIFDDAFGVSEFFGAQVFSNAIDGTGKYLIPGLTEMHGHIPSATEYAQDLQDLLFLYLSQGVTTVRGMLGADGQLQLQQDILDGKILGPTLYLGGRSFNGNSVSSPIQARRMVRDQVKEGWDFLKIHPGLTLDEYNAMADEAAKQGITWAGHVPENVGLARALQAGQTTIDHIDGYDIYTHGETEPLDQERLALAIQLTLDSGAAIVPTLALWENLVGVGDIETLDAMPELKYIPAATRAGYHTRFAGEKPTAEEMEGARQNVLNRRRILKALYDAGVPILLGSDAPQLYSVPGFSIAREMAAMSGAGIDNAGILKSGTANPGEFFAAKDTFGKIAEGYRADLILLDANPLDDIANISSIAGVMVRGVWLSREEIDQKLAEIAARNAQ